MDYETHMEHDCVVASLDHFMHCHLQMRNVNEIRSKQSNAEPPEDNQSVKAEAQANQII
jgi:hypothetical protein